MGYWNDETPIEVKTPDGRIAYYPIAKMLQVSFPDWTDSYGQHRFGKTVVFPVDRFKGNELVKGILNVVISDL